MTNSIPKCKTAQKIHNRAALRISQYAFTGQELDTSGVQYHRARYYDPSLGAWLSLDPLEMGNRYTYVNGDPVNALDPSGLIGELPPVCNPIISQSDRDCSCYEPGFFLFRPFYTSSRDRCLAGEPEFPPCTSPTNITPTPTPRPLLITTEILPTATNTPMPSPSPTVTLSPTPSPTSVPACPRNALFGCYPNSNQVIRPIEWGGNHASIPQAVDIVPETAFSPQQRYSYLQLPPNWDMVQGANTEVYSIVSGEAYIFTPFDRNCSGCVDIRIRTGEGICYQYKHITSIYTPNTRVTVSAGDLIGHIINNSLDPTLGIGAGTDSHLHIDFYRCADDEFFSLESQLNQNIRDEIEGILRRVE